MQYKYYRKAYPGDIIVCIEEYNREKGTIVFDFIESGNLILFEKLINQKDSLERPSMVQLKNYSQRRIQENTYYGLSGEVVSNWFNSGAIKAREDSFLIGFEIDAVENSSNNSTIFRSSISFDDFDDLILLGRGKRLEFSDIRLSGNCRR